MRRQIRIKFILPLLSLILLLPSRAYADETQTLNTGWLLETARTVILTNDPWMDSDCSVDITDVPDDLIIYREGSIRVDGILERNPTGLRDISAVSVEVYVDDELYMRFDPSSYIDVTMTVFVTTTSIDRDQVVSASDIEESSVDVRELPTGELYESADEIIGLAARTNIQSGRILTDGLLELPTLVERGSTVTVSVPFGNAVVSLIGTALDSGAIGDDIRVRNPDSDVIISATVTGVNTAEIRI